MRQGSTYSWNITSILRNRFEKAPVFVKLKF
jgi:hypothetical protein